LPKKSVLRGYLYIASAAFLWGISASLGRAAFTGRISFGSGGAVGSIDPLILSQTRTTFTFFALAVAMLLLAACSRRPLWRVPTWDLHMLLLGVFGVAGSNYFYYLAIQRTNVATAILLQYTAPVWVLLYWTVRRKERPSPRRVGGVLLAVAGIAMLLDLFTARALRLDAIGITAALLSAFCFAFYNVSGHGMLERYNRWPLVLYTTGAAALFWACVNPPWRLAVAHFSGGQWLYLLVFAIVSALAPFCLYAAGLQHLEPTRAVVASCLEPVFTVAIAAVALGESLGSAQIAGLGLVLFATVLVQLPERNGKPELVVEPIE